VAKAAMGRATHGRGYARDPADSGLRGHPGRGVMRVVRGPIMTVEPAICGTPVWRSAVSV
jgi:hypothetical protein